MPIRISNRNFCPTRRICLPAIGTKNLAVPVEDAPFKVVEAKLAAHVTVFDAASVTETVLILLV
jgi:hypothetical protein